VRTIGLTGVVTRFDPVGKGEDFFVLGAVCEDAPWTEYPEFVPVQA
jgi:hypothetical protein